MNVMLVSPSTFGIDRRIRFGYPTGLGYLSAALEAAGHRVTVHDFYGTPWREAGPQLARLLVRESPDVVGLQCLTMNRVAACEAAQLARRTVPRATVVMGHVHASTLYEQILTHYPVDVIVRGEGEVTLVELLAALERGETDLGAIPGLAFCRDGQVVATPPRPLVDCLDTLPQAHHHHFADYIRETGVAHLIMTRGCPVGCLFCSTTRYWGRRFRRRSPERVADEVEEVVRKFGARHIHFMDDAFTLHRPTVEAFCREMIRRRLGVTWECSARVNPASAETFRLMREAGCVYVGFGVESGSEAVLARIGKKITRRQICRAFRLATDAGLRTGAFLMVGNPGETLGTVYETLRLLDRLPICDIHAEGYAASMLQIYPNSELYDEVKACGAVDDAYWLTPRRSPLYTLEHAEDRLRLFANRIMVHSWTRQGPRHLARCMVDYRRRSSWRSLGYVFYTLLASPLILRMRPERPHPDDRSLADRLLSPLKGLLCPSQGVV